MQKLRTHYEILRIAQDAPPEIVESAFLVLTQKYLKGDNSGAANRAEAMAQLSESYKVLSDPIARKKYDESIRCRDLATKSKSPQIRYDEMLARTATIDKIHRERLPISKLNWLYQILKFWPLYAGVATIVYLWSVSLNSEELKQLSSQSVASPHFLTSLEC